MIIITIAGFASSIITIITFFVAKRSLTKKIISGIYILFVSVIMCLYLRQLTINTELRSIEKQAIEILNDYPNEESTNGEKLGYIYECFVFLEKYKDRFPESYIKANNFIQRIENRTPNTSEKTEGRLLKEDCATMQGFIKGIGILK